MRLCLSLVSKDIPTSIEIKISFQKHAFIESTKEWATSADPAIRVSLLDNFVYILYTDYYSIENKIKGKSSCMITAYSFMT